MMHDVNTDPAGLTQPDASTAMARRQRLFAILHQRDLSLRAARHSARRAQKAVMPPLLSPSDLVASLEDQPRSGW